MLHGVLYDAYRRGKRAWVHDRSRPRLNYSLQPPLGRGRRSPQTSSMARISAAESLTKRFSAVPFAVEPWLSRAALLQTNALAQLRFKSAKAVYYRHEPIAFPSEQCLQKLHDPARTPHSPHSRHNFPRLLRTVNSQPVFALTSSSETPSARSVSWSPPLCRSTSKAASSVMI